MDDAEGVHAPDEGAAEVGEAGVDAVAAGVAGLMPPGHADGDDALLGPPVEIVGIEDGVGAFEEEAAARGDGETERRREDEEDEKKKKKKKKKKTRMQTPYLGPLPADGERRAEQTRHLGLSWADGERRGEQIQTARMRGWGCTR